MGDKTETERVAFITGASSKLGRLLVKYILEKGYYVIAHYNSSKESVFQLQKKHFKVDPVKGDFNCTESILELINYIKGRYSRLDLIINNLSIFYKLERIEELSLTELERIFYINLLSPIWINLRLYPLLKATQGNIINIIDNFALRPYKGYSIYGITRAAMEYLTRAFALEFAPEVRVNGIILGSYIFDEDYKEKGFPSFFNRLPLRKKIEVEEIINTIDYIIKSKSLTGAVIKLDLGESLIR